LRRALSRAIASQIRHKHEMVNIQAEVTALRQKNDAFAKENARLKAASKGKTPPLARLGANLGPPSRLTRVNETLEPQVGEDGENVAPL
jgi:hypothetical protein